MKKIIIILFAFASILKSQSPVNNSTVQNVFLINIDGIRNTEAFEAGDKYLRYLWDSLRPNGTIYTNFYNTGVTVTNSGHSTLISGVRQILPNNFPFTALIKPVEPGIGECLIKFSSIPSDKVFYISGKYNIWVRPVSMYPGFGEPYAPTILLPIHYDTTTYRIANEVIDNYHPKFAYILFAEVDESGHTYDSAYYHGSIRIVDSLIFRLWKKVQADPVYANNITFIITTDHGRHDINHGDWQNHGDQCHGCRHIPLMAIGPNIKSNYVSSVFREQIDVAPTMAYMLGLTMPFSQGNIMTEMLNTFSPVKKIHNDINKPNDIHTEINISNTSGHSRSPSITSSGNNVHILYSDNSSGKWNIYYRKSTDYGISWSAPTILFSTLSGQDLEPVIGSSGNNLCAAVTGFKYSLPDSTYKWGLHSRISSDDGNSWEPDTFIDSLSTISCKPSMSMNSAKVLIGALRYYAIYDYTSGNRGVSFKRSTVFNQNYSKYPSAVLLDTSRYIAWQSILQISAPAWNIHFKKQPYSNPWTQLTFNHTNVYSYFPDLTGSPGNIHVVYGTLLNSASGNYWDVFYNRYSVPAHSWQDPVIISGGRNAYQPLIKVSDNGKIFVAWNDYESDLYSVRGIYSENNGASWSNSFPITTAQNYICNPDFSVNGDTLYVTWQDYRLDNWEIYFKKFDISTIIMVQSESENAFNYELKQNYPNPFNPVTKIKFSVPKTGNNKEYVSLLIYNPLGQLIQTLVSKQLKTGTYEVDFDGTNYPSGVYYYTLFAGDYKETRKMILLR